MTPTPAGGQHESPVGGEIDRKRLDVKVWEDDLGLLLSVSIKTYSFQDWDERKRSAGRYTKNIKRNDLELRDEADVVHRRQPFAVLVAVLFEPAAAARDGIAGNSSFAHAVLTLRKRTGRLGPEDVRFDKFERVYVGLYEYEGPQRGAVRFFDVRNDPPFTGLPSREATLTFPDLVMEMTRLVAERNEEKARWSTDIEIDEE